MNRFSRALLYGCAVVSIAIAMNSCKKDDSSTGPTPGGNVAVSGVVQAFGGQAIANATVQFYTGNTTVGTPLRQTPAMHPANGSSL